MGLALVVVVPQQALSVYQVLLVRVMHNVVEVKLARAKKVNALVSHYNNQFVNYNGATISLPRFFRIFHLYEYA